MCKLESVLAQMLEGRFNIEFQTPWLSCISNAALFSLKLLMSTNVFRANKFEPAISNTEMFQKKFFFSRSSKPIRSFT